MYLPYGAPRASAQRKTEEWDIVFLGNPFGSNGRRQEFLRAADKEFNCCPIRLAWGDEKYRLINSAKICLNLHQFSSASFESPRIFELLSEGTFVLSERIDNPFPFVEGRDFVAFAGTNEMIEKARYYLKNPEARSAIAEAGKTTALGFRQEDMFKLLSTSIHRCKTVKRHVASSFSSWSGGIMRNSIIETVDLAAKIKRGVMQKVIKH
jgi:glycosyltransferase involved in cell wall biosynthesis